MRPWPVLSSPSAAITLSWQEQGRGTSSAGIWRRMCLALQPGLPEERKSSQLGGHMGGDSDKVLTPCPSLLLLRPSARPSHLMGSARYCPSCQGTPCSLGWRDPIHRRPPPSLHVLPLLPGAVRPALSGQGAGGEQSQLRLLTPPDSSGRTDGSHSSAGQRWGH